MTHSVSNFRRWLGFVIVLVTSHASLVTQLRAQPSGGPTSGAVTANASTAILVSPPTFFTANGIYGIGNAFTQFTGPTTSTKTFTLPNQSATLLYSGGALGTPSSGMLTSATGLPISTGLTGAGTGVLTALGIATNSAGGFSPIDGVATLTNKTINGASNTLTIRLANDISGFGANVAAFLATPSSANLLAALTTSTGTGSAVFGTSPTIVTPTISSVTSAALANLTFGTGTFGTALTFASATGAPTFAASTLTLGPSPTISASSGGITLAGGGAAPALTISSSTASPGVSFASTNGSTFTLDATGNANTLATGTGTTFKVLSVTAATNSSSGAFQLSGIGMGSGYIFTTNDITSGGSLLADGAATGTSYIRAKAAAGASAISTYQTGDTSERWQVLGSGTIQWSGGGGADAAANLYRSTTGTIKTDGNFISAGTISQTLNSTNVFTGPVQTYKVVSSAGNGLQLLNGAGLGLTMAVTTGNAVFDGTLTVSSTGTSSFAGRLDVATSVNIGSASAGTLFIGLNRSVAGAIQNSAIPAFDFYHDGSNLQFERYTTAGVFDGGFNLRTGGGFILQNASNAALITVAGTTGVTTFGATTSGTSTTNAAVLMKSFGATENGYIGGTLNVGSATSGVLATFGATVNNNSITVSRTGANASSTTLRANTDQSIYDFTGSYSSFFYNNTTEIMRLWQGGGINIGSPYGDPGAKNVTVGGTVSSVGAHTAMNATAIPAGGTAGSGYLFSSTTNFGVFFGSGAPTLSAAKGSLYLRSDGSGTTDRAYINTNGSTTWTALTTSG